MSEVARGVRYLRSSPRVALLGIAALTGCGPAVGSGPPPPATASSGAAIATDDLPAEVRCMVAHGATLVRILPPEFEGDKPGHVLEIPVARGDAVREACNRFREPERELTVPRIRAIYDRWVHERNCLDSLGYRPVDPPSFETFLKTWKTGPWDPLNGVNTNAWSEAEYRTAKERCVLSAFTRE